MIVCGLSLLGLAVFWQAGTCSFINFDDDQYVYENPAVLRGLSPESVSWAFATFHSANWHPLTWLSHMADVEWFGLDAGWHHRVNGMFHLANTVLLFLVLWRMTGGLWQSAFVAALFGVHPLHVESVAWVAERKDVLSTLFWILTMGAYLRYVRKPGVARYLVVAVCYSLGLMCKPMLVTLPFVLLLLDWWPLRSFGEEPFSRRVVSRRVFEKIPLLLMSAASCVLTYLAQGKALSSMELVPLGLRFSNAVVSYAKYLGKTFWPAALAVFYPHAVSVRAGIPTWQVAGAALLLGGVTFLGLRWRKHRPYVAVGWLWYLGTLLPVIGLVQVGAQAYADRYTYVPLIGVFIVIAWGIPEILGEWRFRRPALGGTGGAIILVLGITAWFQMGHWRNSITLYTHSLEVTDRNWEAWGDLGRAYDNLGQHQEAIACYLESVRIKPDYAKAWNNLGVSYGKLGQYRQAVDPFREAVRIQPDYSMAWFNLGGAYAALGQRQKAQEVYQRLLQIDPAMAQKFLAMLGPARKDFGL